MFFYLYFSCKNSQVDGIEYQIVGAYLQMNFGYPLISSSILYLFTFSLKNYCVFLYALLVENVFWLAVELETC